MSSSTPMAASPASQLIAMASNSPQSSLTPLQAAAALGMSPPTSAAHSRLGTIAAASLNTPLTSAASPAVSVGGRSLTGISSFLAPTPAHATGQGWRGSRGSGSGSQSVVAGGTHAVRPRTVEEEADAFDGALKELSSLGDVLYDRLESSLSPTAQSLQAEQSLSALISRLDKMLAELASSSLGGITIEERTNSKTAASSITDDDAKQVTVPLKEEIAALKAASDDIYERRMRLREGAGMTAHVLAAGQRRSVV